MTFENRMDDQLTVEEWLEIRKKAALEIDPETAEVRWKYGETCDPYGVDPDLPEEYKSISRNYFARSPNSDIWVSFDDLPYSTRDALWELEIEMASSEMAFAKDSKLSWAGPVNTFKRGGVEAIQVRTRSSDDYDLIIRNDDRGADVFVLVTGKAPHFKIRGWIEGANAKREEWRKSYGGRPPAYLVPEEALKDIRDLMALLDAKNEVEQK